MSDRFTLSVAVFLILRRDNKVLLTRRANTGWKDGDYDLPAGHMDGNERLVDTVVREAKEEVDVEIAAEDLQFTAIAHDNPADAKEYMYAFFEAKHWQGEPRIMEPDKCDDLGWFDIDNLPPNITPGTRDGLQAYKAGVNFIETGSYNEVIQ